MNKFGDKLKALRIQRGLTLQGLAGMLGYRTHGYISELEAGKKAPTVSFVLAVAELFGQTVDDLVRDDIALNLPQDYANETGLASGVAFAERPPTDAEIERLRLLLSTYQDGAGMLAQKDGTTLPGWRDFERSAALAFNGVASESKDIFDIRLPDPQRPGVFFGVSCKMRRELRKLERHGRASLELSNSAGQFWEHLNTKGINQANYKSRPDEVGHALLELVEQWHQASGLEAGGNVDLAKSCYLTLMWSNAGWYQLHQFPLSLPDSSHLAWEIPVYIRRGREELARHLRGSDAEGVVFEWFGESGGQLKYYPLATSAIWESARFELEPLPPRLEPEVLQKARNYFRGKWPQ